MKWFRSFKKDQRGEATLLATLLVMTTLLVIAFALVPYFVFIMQRSHIQSIAGHALKEAEIAGMLTPAIIDQTNQKLANVGMGPVSINGVSYPSYAGSTMTKKLRDSADPTIKIAIKYPASNLSRLFTAIGGASEVSNGFYYIELYGRSEAYE